MVNKALRSNKTFDVDFFLPQEVSVLTRPGPKAVVFLQWVYIFGENTLEMEIAISNLKI